MLNILDAYTTELEPTRTYGRRSIVWIPSDGSMLGELIIKLQHAKSGVGRNIEIDTYGVELDTPEPGDHDGMAFWLVNISNGNSQERPYRCVIGGLTPHCDCMAGKCKVPADEGTQGCKHRDSLQHLLESGLLN